MAAPADTGLFASLRRMLATLLALVHTRLELVGVEIEEQIEHAAGVLLWSIAAIFFASLTVLLLALTVVIAFWDGHRLLAAGLVTASFAATALAAGLVVRRRLRQRPRFLAATVGELRRDAEALEGEAP
ncbi:MAG: phage holin family protein [Proteobacteria bacterium]|nr:phage holin family protein [Pseudomonadota bacterium]